MIGGGFYHCQQTNNENKTDVTTKKNGTKQPRFPLMDDQDKLSSLSSKLLA